ncbi:MAG: hypothetical protein H5T85_05750, partial [Actinobacteria bacterium]|nr:hypothetical protein [Actinomycetota bacterium]
MTKKREEIIKKVIEILKSNPDGIRYSNLIRKIHEELPEIPINTIHGTVWNLDKRLPDEIYKPEKGLWRHTEFRDRVISREGQKPTQGIKEEAFYKPFADWLVGEVEECIKAIPLGGNKFKDKWGTPDVIGVREPFKGDIIKFPTEIV